MGKGIFPKVNNRGHSERIFLIDKPDFYDENNQTDIEMESENYALDINNYC